MHLDCPKKVLKNIRSSQDMCNCQIAAGSHLMEYQPLSDPGGDVSVSEHDAFFKMKLKYCCERFVTSKRYEYRLTGRLET